MRFDYTNPGRQAAISMLALIALLTATAPV
jgi:hypothetical protein